MRSHAEGDEHQRPTQKAVLFGFLAFPPLSDPMHITLECIVPRQSPENAKAGSVLRCRIGAERFSWML
jgi:hypothetical protein